MNKNAITVKVKLPQTPAGNYPIIIARGLLNDIPKLLPQRRYAIISDSKVAARYGTSLCDKLNKHKIKTDLIRFPAGEKNKTRAMKAVLEDKLLKKMFDRSCGIIALGGGVTGDLAGYTAATFMRGIPVIQVPTTLLAQIDSSIGGKTAVNTPLGKNLIGSFTQPQMVLIDPNTLRTLPRRAILDGMGEILKHAVIQDKTMFRELQKNITAIVNPDSQYPIGTLIARNCRIKAKVVMADEKEGGIRQILNFGHTVGHAIENLSKGAISHGEAVSIGMVVESRAAVETTGLTEAECAKIIDLIGAAGLPTTVPAEMSAAAILKKTRHDKKTIGGTVRYALPDKIGNCLHGIAVEDSTIKKALKASYA